MLKILVFAGTTEGRKLVENLVALGYSMHVCVATDYGKDLLEASSHLTKLDGAQLNIHAGRLSTEQMQDLMKKEAFDVVVDATHPYAMEVTENIKTACCNAGRKYMRLLRKSSEYLNKEDCIFVETIQEAVRILNDTDEKVLLTIGSKELQHFTQVKDYKDRLFARVLPMGEVLKSCMELGVVGKHLICMQGPFSCEMNKAMLNQLECKYMVTKDSGKEGGLPEKYRAAQEAGATLLVIGRPKEEEGLSLEDLLENLTGIKFPKQEQLAADWFPLFTNIRGVNVVIIGAGKIAKRRIETLMNFSCHVKVIAKDVSEEVMNLAKQMEVKQDQGKSFELCIKDFEEQDLDNAQMVLAATNNRTLNHHIGQICGQRGILVNVADSKEECDFYFPGIVLKDELVIGISAGGKNHALAKKAGAFIRQSIEDL